MRCHPKIFQLLVIGALQANHMSDDTCDIIRILFTYYLFSILSLYLMCFIYYDINISVQ
ncbi:unnamed protein product [Musa textilis]